jgi:hypothetical protein
MPGGGLSLTGAPVDESAASATGGGVLGKRVSSGGGGSIGNAGRGSGVGAVDAFGSTASAVMRASAETISSQDAPVTRRVALGVRGATMTRLPTILPRSSRMETGKERAVSPDRATRARAVLASISAMNACSVGQSLGAENPTWIGSTATCASALEPVEPASAMTIAAREISFRIDRRASKPRAEAGRNSLSPVTRVPGSPPGRKTFLGFAPYASLDTRRLISRSTSRLRAIKR